MSLLAFSILTMIIGHDIRRRGLAAIMFSQGLGKLTPDWTLAIGGWISFLGAIWLNISVWHLF